MINKQFIRILIFFSVLFSLTFAGIWADSDTVYISKIRIVIEEKSYLWDDKEKIPEKEGGITAPSTVISFISFGPGDRLTVPKLEKKVKLAERRLLLSGYFFKAQVIIVPPRKKPESRTILIKVKEGFLYRFGGGNAFAMFGKENLWGKRKQFELFLGYNLAGGSFVDENFLSRNLVLGTSAY